MNEQIFVASSALSEETLVADKGAFFDSILGTLNHIMVGDLIWLSRFSKHSPQYKSLAELELYSKPKALNEIIY